MFPIQMIANETKSSGSISGLILPHPPMSWWCRGAKRRHPKQGRPTSIPWWFFVEQYMLPRFQCCLTISFSYILPKLSTKWYPKISRMRHMICLDLPHVKVNDTLKAQVSTGEHGERRDLVLDQKPSNSKWIPKNPQTRIARYPDVTAGS